MNIPIDLFLTFARIGLFTFGGGYAMLALIEHDCVEKKGWITHEEMMNITVIAESTPGPIAINCATFTGYKKAGLLGAVAATLGVVFPSFLIILAISSFLDNFLEHPLAANALFGIKAAVGILITDAALGMIRKMNKKPFPVCVTVVSCILMLCINIFSLSFSSVSLMLAAAAAGLAFYGLKGGGKK